MITVPELREKRGNYCEHCNFRQGTQRHHVFFGTKKGESYFDDERNLMLVCAYCHVERAVINGYKLKCVFWARQCKRYGRDSMMEYWRNAPLVVKERFF